MSTLPAWLIESGWQSAIIAVVVFIILAIGGKRIPPSWRYGLLLLVVARMLLPVLPEAKISAYRLVPATPAIAWEQALPTRVPPPWLVPEGHDVMYSPSGSATRTQDWGIVIAYVWMVGAVGFGLWLATWQVLFLRRFLRVRRDPGEKMLMALEIAVNKVGLRRSPRLWVVPGLSSPAATGLLRPMIVIPSGLEQSLSIERLTLVLMHECVHLRRADTWTQGAAIVAWVLHWWNPISWWLLRRLQTERELATDAAVLEAMGDGDKLVYGDTLIAMAQSGLANSAMMQPSVGILESHGDLRRRLGQIAAFTRKPLYWSIAAALLLLGLGAVLLVREKRTFFPPISGDTQSRGLAVNDFLEAVRKGNIKKADIYLRRGLDLDVMVPNNEALFWAVTNGDVQMLRFLLSHGANVNLPSSKGDSVVNRACETGNKIIADILIKNGAQCDPLRYAIGTGDLKRVELRSEQKPFDEKEIKSLAPLAVTANQPAVFDWFWKRLSSNLDAEARQKLLGSYYVDAARWGRLDMMRHLEALGVNVDKLGYRALCFAITRNRVREAVYLLDRGVSPNDGSSRYRSTLGDAAGAGHLEMVKALLDHGVAINTQDQSGMTPLAWAAYCGHGDVCRLLIERGADITKKDKNGQNALFAAVFCGRMPDIVDLLLKKGADVHSTDSAGTPILSAFLRFVPPTDGRQGDLPGMVYTEGEMATHNANMRKTLRLLVKAGADLNAPGGYPGTPLCAAIQYGHGDIAMEMIRLGADINQLDRNGTPPIANSVITGFGNGINTAVLRMLLDGGADPNALSISILETSRVPVIELALTVAGAQHDKPTARKKSQVALDLLLRHGAEFSVEGDSRGAEFLTAAAQGDLSALKRLHEAGVEINLTTKSGWGALSMALAMDRGDAAQWLIGQGADLAPGNTLYPPLLYAVQNNDLPLVERMLDAGAKPSIATMEVASLTGNAELFAKLIKAGGDPSQVTLFNLVQRGNSKILKMALDGGADAKKDGNPENRNNVYWAVYYDQIDCLKLLLQHGANPSLKDDYGGTALEYAKKFRLDMVPLLEEAIRGKVDGPAT